MSESACPSFCCPQCGATLPAEATEGMCPRCLLAQAMATPSATQVGAATPDHADALAAEALAPFFPNYEMLRMLGRGGMGAVYLARQISLNRLVAIKILPAEIDDGQNHFAERFKNEAQAMAQLSHPGIVAVYDFGQTTNGLLYIVMEYIDGLDVQQMVAREGRLHSGDAMAITAHVCDALAYAHSRGIIHRDIKPSNIMIAQEGGVKVADFGLAKMHQASQTQGLTQSGFMMGTLHFMAPEALVLGSAVDQRADIYAVGVMLYQMLTGRLPQGLFEMPSLQVPGLDPRYDGIVAKALREDRALRYQSAADLRHDLDAIVTQPVVRLSTEEVEKAAAAAKPQVAARQPARAAAPGAKGGRMPQARQEMAPRPAGKKLQAAGAFLVLCALVGVLCFWGVLGPHFDAARVRLSGEQSGEGTPVVNSLGMKFVPVPGTGILMCTSETRRQDYAAYAAAVPGVNRAWETANHKGVPIGQEDSHPVCMVSWDDAQAFCRWLSRKEGRSYRLPTDREWSMAVGIDAEEQKLGPGASPRALFEGTERRYPWGGDFPPEPGSQAGNYGDASYLEKVDPAHPSAFKDYRDGFATTAPVMSFKPNALGLYDLGGNLWEWVEDRFDPAGTQKNRTMRGGSCQGNDSFPRLLASSGRRDYTPESRLDFTGFRIVLDLKKSGGGAAAAGSAASSVGR